MGELPAGTVTFLFTDLEGSTRLWEEHPEAMKGALARHDEILRVAVAANGGTTVKTTGDGVHAAFPTAHDALSAELEIRGNLAAQSFDATGPLRVRMGAHTCEAELRDGDYYGSGVNAARTSPATRSERSHARRYEPATRHPGNQRPTFAFKTSNDARS